MPLKKTPRSSFSRLLAVAAWAIVAALAAPGLRADKAPSEAQPSSETVIYPKEMPAAAPQSGTSPLRPDAGVGSGPYAIVILILVGAGVWLLWKRRGGEMSFGSKTHKKLQVEESKSLGNRQFLVVASYEDKRFLLGVTAERIQLLADLPKKEGNEQ